MAFAEITVPPSAPMPKGYKFLHKGYAFMTALCRRKTIEAGQALYVVRAGSRTLGLRAPRHIINKVYEEERQTRATRRAAVTARDETTRGAFETALRKQFPNIPSAEAEKVLQRTLKKRSGRVGRTSKLSIEDKVRLAVAAHARHMHTDYDNLVSGKTNREDARKAVLEEQHNTFNIKPLSTIYKWLSWARFPLADNFPPSLSECDGRLISKLITPTISYYMTENALIKRQPHASELRDDIYGNPVVIPYIADRLKNEAAVLRYLRVETTIPVPELLDLQTINGLVYLKTAWIEGAVELCAIPNSRINAAVAAVSAQLESEVLPQLRGLRSRRMGSPDTDIPIIPPRRFWGPKESRAWPSIVGDYTFCHMDLDRQNILVHPETYKIIAIIDWEMAGFFPPGWELPLWKQSNHEERSNLLNYAKDSENGFFEETSTICRTDS